MLPKGRRRESYLGYFGPLLLLFLLVIWAGFLIVGFSLLLLGRWLSGADPGRQSPAMPPICILAARVFSRWEWETSFRTTPPRVCWQ